MTRKMPSPSYLARRRRDWLDDDRYADDEGDKERHSVVWVDDQRFIRQVRDEAQHASIPIPAPTQCVVPIDDHHNANSPASASSSRSTTRKRPRRAVRHSLPVYETPYDLNASISDSAAGPSSAPYNGDGGLLDDLLDQAERLYVEPVPKASRKCRQSSALPPTGTYGNRGIKSGSALREQSMNTSRSGSTSVSSQKGRFILPQPPASDDLQKMPYMSHHSSEESMTSTSTMTDDSLLVTPHRNQHNCENIGLRHAQDRGISPTTIAHPPTATMSHTAHSLHTSGPRIGIRAPKPAADHPASRGKLNKPFRPPAAQPLRSSPRQHGKQPIYNPRSEGAKTPSRASTASIPPSDLMTAQERRRAAMLQTANMLASSAARPVLPPPQPPRMQAHTIAPVQAQRQPAPPPRPPSPDPIRTKMPSSDGVGNESIDSFDGLLLNGDEEWDAVLRTVDGA